MRISISIICFVLAIGFQALAASTSPTPPDQTSGMTNKTPEVSRQKDVPGSSVPTDSQIVQIVISANDAEIDNGKLAQKRATNAEVKDFAKEIERTHKDANKQLHDLVRKQEIMKEKSQTSLGIDAIKDDTSKELKKISGNEFDRAYLTSQVSLHQMILTSLDQDLIPNAESKEVKQYLIEFRPSVESQLKKAKDLSAKFSTNDGSTGKE